MTAGSLGGVRVVEIGTSVAAPTATQVLGDLGADVVKVERTEGGDDSRQWAPPHWAGESVTFSSLNRNKRSLAVDFKSPAGRDVLEKLLVRADVLVHNLRPGSLAAAGFDAARLAELNPMLVHCELTGYGPRGPQAGRPAYDPLLQAYSGIVSITGAEGGAPARVPVSLLDMGTGVWTALAVLEALRRRDRSGRGCHVELSLLQTALHWLSMPVSSVLAGNPAPSRMGSGLSGVVPYGAYPTSDGWVFVSAGNDAAWRRLTRALGADGLAAEPAFTANASRVAHRSACDAALGAVTSRFVSAEVLRLLQDAQVPCAPVQSLDQVVTDEQVLATGVISPLEHPRIDGFAVVNSPVTFDGEYLSHRHPPPALGEHSAEVLAELGFTDTEVSALVGDGIVGDGRPAPVGATGGSDT